MYKTGRGKPLFGANVDDMGTNFAVFSKNATKVYLEIYENFYDDTPCFSTELDNVKNKTGDVWHIYVYDIKDGMNYGWRMDGPFEPENGHINILARL